MTLKKLKPIADLTDSCLLMPTHRQYSWQEWWKDVLGLGSAPARKTLEWAEFLDIRNKIKGRINRELRARNRAERLKSVGNGKGLYLVDKADVAMITVEEAARNLVHAANQPIVECDCLAECSQLSERDRRTLRSTVDFLRAQKDAALIGISRLPSLPEAARTEIVKKLGFSPSEKPKRRKRA